MLLDNSELKSFIPSETRINPVVYGSSRLVTKTNAILPPQMASPSVFSDVSPSPRITQEEELDAAFENGKVLNSKSTPMIISVKEPPMPSEYSDDGFDADLARLDDLRKKAHVTDAEGLPETPLGVGIALHDRIPELLSQEEFLAGKGKSGEIPPGVVPVLVYSQSGDKFTDMSEHTVAAVRIAMEKQPRVLRNGRVEKLGSSHLDNLVLPSSWIYNAQGGLVKAAVGCFEVPLPQARERLTTFNQKFEQALVKAIDSQYSPGTCKEELLQLYLQERSIELDLAQLFNQGMEFKLFQENIEHKEILPEFLKVACSGRYLGSNQISGEADKILKDISSLINNFSRKVQSDLTSEIRIKMKKYKREFSLLDANLFLGMDPLIEKVSEKLGNRVSEDDIERFGHEPVVLTTDKENGGSEQMNMMTNGTVVWDTVDDRTFAAVVGSQYRAFSR